MREPIAMAKHRDVRGKPKPLLLHEKPILSLYYVLTKLLYNIKSAFTSVNFPGYHEVVVVVQHPSLRRVLIETKSVFALVDGNNSARIYRCNVVSVFKNDNMINIVILASWEKTHPIRLGLYFPLMGGWRE